MIYDFYARQQNALRVLAIAQASVRRFVRYTLQRCSHVKTVQVKVTKFSLWATRKLYIFRDKILCF